MKKASNKKKTAKKGTGTKKTKAAKTTRKTTRKPKDMGAVRDRISHIVGHAATEITKKLVTKAEDGELAHSKYLFEMAGVYPAAEGAAKPPEEESLAKTLLQRMGLPTTPVVQDESGETQALPAPAVAAVQPPAAKDDE